MNTTIRDIDDWVLSEIKQQAAASGRSQQSYIKHILGEVAKTPLPVDRDILMELMKIFPARKHRCPATRVEVTRHGEFFTSVMKLSREEDLEEPVRILGMDWHFVSYLPPGVHAIWYAAVPPVPDPQPWVDSLEVTTELLWKLAGRVDRTIRLR